MEVVSLPEPLPLAKVSLVKALSSAQMVSSEEGVSSVKAPRLLRFRGRPCRYLLKELLGLPVAVTIDVVSQITGRERLQIRPSPVPFYFKGYPRPTESRLSAPTERLQTQCLLVLTLARPA